MRCACADCCNRYYEFDGHLTRELLGKKLTLRVRNDLDVLGGKVSILLRSCFRQFDNLRRIFSVLEDLNLFSNGDPCSAIEEIFMLPEALAWK